MRRAEPSAALLAMHEADRQRGVDPLEIRHEPSESSVYGPPLRIEPADWTPPGWSAEQVVADLGGQP